MNVIGHQAPGQDLHPEGVRLLADQAQVGDAVLVGAEDSHRTNTALGDMVRVAGNDDSGQARHGERVAGADGPVKKLVLCPEYTLNWRFRFPCPDGE
jgi:hypothetical protein